MMNWWIFGAVVVGIVVLGYLAQRFGMIDLVGKTSSKGSGSGSGIMGIGDEVFAPSRHEAAVEMDRQTILPAPAPLAGDRGRQSAQAAVYSGRVTIDLKRTKG